MKRTRQKIIHGILSKIIQKFTNILPKFLKGFSTKPSSHSIALFLFKYKPCVAKYKYGQQWDKGVVYCAFAHNFLPLEKIKFEKDDNCLRRRRMLVLH